MIASQRKRALGHGVCKPTRTQIRRACREIRATWSRQVRAERNVAAWWTPPTIRLPGLIAAINEERADRATYFGVAGNEV